MFDKIKFFIKCLKIKRKNNLEISKYSRIKELKLKAFNKNNIKFEAIKIKASKLHVKNNCEIIFKEKVQINKSIFELDNNSQIILGENVKLFNCNFKLKNNCKIEIKENTQIDNSEFILDEGNSVFIGRETSVGGMKVFCTGKENCVKIGNNCMLSFEINIRNTDNHKIYKNGIRINQDKPVEIKDKVWIGQGVTILKGVTIEEGSIIGNRAIVSKSLNKVNSIYVGIPAKCVKEDVAWER